MARWASFHASSRGVRCQSMTASLPRFVSARKPRGIVAAVAERRYMLVVLRSSPFIPPCEPTLRDRLPKGEGWRYEVKFDGYRMQIHKAGRAVTLYTRNGA